MPLAPPDVQMVEDAKSASSVDRLMEAVAFVCVNRTVLDGWPLMYTCTSVVLVAGGAAEEDTVDAVVAVVVA